MKIAITGTTSGIGKELSCQLSKDGHDVLELNKNNGFDISRDADNIANIDFDVFINNAHHNFSQVNLLFKLWELNKNRKCIIISIGSVSGDGNKDKKNKYAIQKSALEKSCKQLQLTDSDAKVCLLKLGRVDTPLVKHITDYPKLDPFDIYNAISWILSQPQKITIKNLTIDSFKSSEKLD